MDRYVYMCVCVCVCVCVSIYIYTYIVDSLRPATPPNEAAFLGAVDEVLYV